MTLMDLLDWRGGLFLDWASAAFRDGERHGSGELPEDSSSSVGISMSSMRNGLFAFARTGRRE